MTAPGVCVQSLQGGHWSFIECETTPDPAVPSSNSNTNASNHYISAMRVAFTVRMPGACAVVPGPLVYCAQTDSVVTGVVGAYAVESYRYICVCFLVEYVQLGVDI